MDFMTAVKSVYSNYVGFSGRARRSEFWWFALFYFVVNLVLSLVDSVLFGTTVSEPGSFSASTDTPIFSGIFALASLLPSLAVSVRRLHDLDKSGWWLLLSFIPLIGAIVLIVWFATAGTKGSNRFGEDQLGDGEGGPGPIEETGFARSNIPGVERD